MMNYNVEKITEFISENKYCKGEIDKYKKKIELLEQMIKNKDNIYYKPNNSIQYSFISSTIFQ